MSYVCNSAVTNSCYSLSGNEKVVAHDKKT